MNFDVILDGWPTLSVIATTLGLAGIVVCLLVDAICRLTTRAQRRREEYFALMRDHLREMSQRD